MSQLAEGAAGSVDIARRPELAVESDADWHDPPPSDLRQTPPATEEQP
jgi:hypothetical protein